MNRKVIIIVCVAIALIGIGGYLLFGKSTNEQPVAEEHAEEDSTEIPAAIADKSGIVVGAVGPGTVSENITLTGRITLNQKTTAQIKARFPGIVRSVKKSQGETVKAGEVLATIESNDSLQIYPVISPIDGIVLALNTNVGDVASEAPIFTVADVSDVWAEFHIFPRDIDRIRNGQKVTVTSFEGHHSGAAVINVVLPVAETSSQTIIARVLLQNEQGLWHSGMTVRGDVAVNVKQVSLAVATSALQRMEGKTVVFVRTGEHYAMRPVTVGLSDPEWTEVHEGLKPGEIYVSKNSFLIKADIGKAGAEHED